LLELIVALDVAESLRTAGRLREADAAFAHAWDRLAAMGRDDTLRASTLLNNWALVLRGMGQPLAAERLYRRAIAIESAGGNEDSVAPMLYSNLGRVALDMARLDEAGELADRAYAGARRDGDQTVVLFALFLRQIVHTLRGELGPAGQTMAEMEALVAAFPADHYYHLALASQQALLAEARGDTARARALHDRAVAGADAQDLVVLLPRRSAFALAQGDLEQAADDASRVVAVASELIEPGTLSSRVGLAHLALARARAAQGRADEARDAARAALVHLPTALGEDHPETRAARELATAVGAAGGPR
jgi:tetratricopeptide (TPR) repeat protein